jgi:uncharacterized protein (TIGR03086 family)
LLLHGAAREVVAEEQQSGIGSDDWIAAFRSAYRTMREAFCAPGALERTVAHPGMGDIPAAMLFDLRLGELAVHGWDLARAIGADETLDPEVVAALWPSPSPCLACCHRPATSVAPAATYRIRLPCKPGCSTC